VLAARNSAPRHCLALVRLDRRAAEYDEIHFLENS